MSQPLPTARPHFLRLKEYQGIPSRSCPERPARKAKLHSHAPAENVAAAGTQKVVRELGPAPGNLSAAHLWHCGGRTTCWPRRVPRDTIVLKLIAREILRPHDLCATLDRGGAPDHEFVMIGRAGNHSRGATNGIRRREAACATGSCHFLAELTIRARRGPQR